jgi:hypothetical protein
MGASIDIEIESGTFSGPVHLRDSWGFARRREIQDEASEGPDPACCPGWQL